MRTLTALVKMTSEKNRAAPAKGSFASRRRNARLQGGYTLVSIVVMITLWEIFGRQINPLFASYPSAIFNSFLEMMENGLLIEGFLSSIQPFTAGYFLAAAVGVPLGLFIGRYSFVESTIGIYVTAGYATPLVAMVPLFILWFGLGFAVKVAIISVLAFFPICINTWAGVRAVPKSLIEVGTSFVASQQAIMLKIVLPATLPYIIAGLKLAIGRAVIAMVIAEFFTAINGLGGIIMNSASNFDTHGMFVPIIVLMLIAIGLNTLVGWIERKVAPWQKDLAGRDVA